MLIIQDIPILYGHSLKVALSQRPQPSLAIAKIQWSLDGYRAQSQINH